MVYDFVLAGAPKFHIALPELPFFCFYFLKSYGIVYF